MIDGSYPENVHGRGPHAIRIAGVCHQSHIHAGIVALDVPGLGDNRELADQIRVPQTFT